MSSNIRLRSLNLFMHKLILATLLLPGALFANPNEDLIKSAQSDNLAGVQIALDAGANVNAADKVGKTALMQASFEGLIEIVELLVGAKANVNAKDKNGATALMVASEKGYSVIVARLIRAKANVNAKDKDGVTALMLSSKNGKTEIVELLKAAGAK
jgi:uncharacterized protein